MTNITETFDRVLGSVDLKRKRLLRAGMMAASIGVMLVGIPMFGSVSVTLTPSITSIPVGGTVSFTASATDSTNSKAFLIYRFRVRNDSTSSWGSIIKDYWYDNTFQWTPSDHEGTFDVTVDVFSSTGGYGKASNTIDVTSRITNGSPVVSSTSHPLVAFYSAPPCQAPATVHVLFEMQGQTSGQSTSSKACNGLSLNFYVAGMRASTTYFLQQALVSGSSTTYGPKLTFTTGTIPSSAALPSTPSISKAEQPPTSNTYPFLLRLGIFGAYATDPGNNIVWYLPPVPHYLTRLVNGGTLLGIADYRKSDERFLREYDLAGNVIKETNWTMLNTAINGIRASQHKSAVHLNFISHEGLRLPNGYTALIVTDEEIANQGDGNGNVDVLGDMVVVLDSNFQVKWLWNSFDFLDITRKAILDDKCTAGQAGCPNLARLQPNGQVYTVANDWTHANSVWLDPKDNNLIISVRHQNWVVKVAYANGSGDGHIIWRLGQGGNFTLASGYTAADWFSYQHDVEFQSNGLLTLFDNGNSRIPTYGGNSRGQAWQLDETNFIATPVFNYDLGVQSLALGSAQLLSNGNYSFGAGFVNGKTGETFELTPSYTLVSEQGDTALIYRSFRVPDMYTAP